MYKANLKERGKELTVYFTVSTRDRGRCEISGCAELSQGGLVTVTSVIHDGVELSPQRTLWHRVSTRLENLFITDLCTDHLKDLADRRRIVLDLTIC